MTEETKQANPWADSPEEQEAAASGGGFSRVENLKMKQGKNVLRIVGTYKMFRQYWLPQVKRTVVAGPLKDCPIFNHPEKAVLFAKGAKLKDAGKDKQAKEVFRQAYSTYEPRVNYAVNVIDREDGVMKVWKFSRAIKEDIMNIATEFGDPTSYDLVVTRKGVKLETKYSVTASRNTDELTEGEKKLRVHNLSKLFQPTPIEKVQAYLRGEIPKKSERNNTSTAPEAIDDQQRVAVDEVEIPSPEELEDLGNFE